MDELIKHFPLVYPLLVKEHIYSQIPEGPILDIGFEQGHSLAFFSQKEVPKSIAKLEQWIPREVWGIDLEEHKDFLEVKNRFPEIPKIILGDIFDVSEDIPDRHFSLILLSKVIHFYELRKAQEMIDIALKKLKPGGIIFLRVYSVEDLGINNWINHSSDAQVESIKEINIKEGIGRTFECTDQSIFDYRNMRFYVRKELSDMLLSSNLEIVIEELELITEGNENPQSRKLFSCIGKKTMKGEESEGNNDSVRS